MTDVYAHIYKIGTAHQSKDVKIFILEFGKTLHLQINISALIKSNPLYGSKHSRINMVKSLKAISNFVNIMNVQGYM